MKKRIGLGFGLFCLLGLSALTLWAASGRESMYLPPQEVEIMYAAEDHAYQAKDINDAVRWKVLPDGTMAIYNSSGTTVYAIRGSNGQPILTKGSWQILDTEAEAEAKSSAYNIYLVDMVNYVGHIDSTVAGVSVYLPPGSEALDGFVVEYVNISASGTTDLILVPANDYKQASGITDHLVCVSGTTYSTGGTAIESRIFNVADAQWEGITLIYRYVNASGGTWYQIDAK